MPVLMGCALLWWIGRGMSWTRQLSIAAITLTIIAIVVFIERGVK